jgi:hypothetical protein
MMMMKKMNFLDYLRHTVIASFQSRLQRSLLCHAEEKTTSKILIDAKIVGQFQS